MPIHKRTGDNKETMILSSITPYDRRSVISTSAICAKYFFAERHLQVTHIVSVKFQIPHTRTLIKSLSLSINGQIYFILSTLSSIYFDGYIATVQMSQNSNHTRLKAHEINKTKRTRPERFQHHLCTSPSTFYGRDFISQKIHFLCLPTDPMSWPLYLSPRSRHFRP